jgi:Tol biopolymer transport system component
MASVIRGYEYDIFVSYRQKDNRHDGWVTEFVNQLKDELESTFKEEIGVYFDINPHDGLLETHDVDESLKDKLKCLVFIPIISRTYCDPKSFAWEHEFKAFVQSASIDQVGLKIKLPNGNVASRVLPIKIYDLDTTDIKLCESVLGGILRGLDFVFSSPGVNRPLKPSDDPAKNIHKTYYPDQVNKVANTIKEIISCLIPQSDKLVDLQESSAIEPEVLKKQESDLKVSKIKNINHFLKLSHWVKHGKKSVIPILSSIIVILILSSVIFFETDKSKFGPTSIYANVPVESLLMDNGGQYPYFDLSPDGKTIAYFTASGIELKSLSGFTKKILEGTSTSGSLTFSPDGKFIAFASGGIKKIGITGSPLSVVCDHGGGCLFWGCDNNIYFMGGLGSGGIWRVSSNGGNPEQVTYVIDTLGENAHTWPQLLPDSKTLLFTSLGPSGGSLDSKIVIQRLNSKERKILVTNAIFGRYLSNGNILYANNEGNIFIVPFNLHKLKISGESKAVLSDVNTSTWSGAAFLRVSETGNLIFLPRNNSPILKCEVLDRSGKVIPEDSIPLKTYEMIGHGWVDLKISPSGEFFALTGRTYGNVDIWLVNIKRKDVERITFEPSEDEYAVWSPYGKSIAYSSAMKGTSRKILIQNLDFRGNAKHVLIWPRHIHLTDWSPDGKWFAAYDYTSNSGMDLYAISVNSGEFIPVSTTKSNESGGQFSPDGKWLTYISNQSGRYETYIVSFPDLKNKRQFLNSNETELHWDKNRKYIYYRTGGYIVTQEIDIYNGIKKGNAIRLFYGLTGSFCVSPDGKKFYFTTMNKERPFLPLSLITNWYQELEKNTGKSGK